MDPIQILNDIVALITDPAKAEEFGALSAADVRTKLTELAAAAAAVRPNVTTDEAARTAFAAVANAATVGRARHDELAAAEATALAAVNADDTALAAATTFETPAPVEPSTSTPAEPTATELSPEQIAALNPAPPVGLPGAPASVADLTPEQLAAVQAQYGTAPIDATPRPPVDFAILRGAPEVEPVVGTGIKASSRLGNVNAGDEVPELAMLGQAFKDLSIAHATLQPSPDNPHPLGGNVRLGTIEHSRNSRTVFADDPDIKAQGLTDDQLIELATKQVVEMNTRKDGMLDSIKASGGPCAQAESDYEVILKGGDLTTSFIGGLPSIVKNRELSVYDWINFSMANRPAAATSTVPGNFNKVTAAQDTAGYYPGTLSGQDLTDAIALGKAVEKGCIHIDCINPRALSFHAIYQCLTIGNFINISFPEYVAVWKEKMATYFQISREEDAIAKVVTRARKINLNADVLGANRDLYSAISRYVASMRSERHSPNMRISLVFPEFANPWLLDDHQKQMFHNSDLTAIQRIARDIPNLDISYYNVSAGATIGGAPTVLPAIPQGSLTGTGGTTTGLQGWPAEMRVLAFPTGGVYQQKVGNLGFGLRETGMGTNDFSMFMEIFEETHIRTADLAALDIKLCAQGEAAGSSVIACA